MTETYPSFADTIDRLASNYAYKWPRYGDYLDYRSEARIAALEAVPRFNQELDVKNPKSGGDWQLFLTFAVANRFQDLIRARRTERKAVHEYMERSDAELIYELPDLDIKRFLESLDKSDRAFCTSLLENFATGIQRNLFLVREELGLTRQQARTKLKRLQDALRSHLQA